MESAIGLPSCPPLALNSIVMGTGISPSADDREIAAAFMLPDDDDDFFLRELFAAFPDWDRSLPVKTIKQQVLLAVEAIMCAYWLTY